MNIADVSTRPVEVHQSRSIRERVNGVEQIRIPKRCNWFVLLWQVLQVCILVPLAAVVAIYAPSGSPDVSTMLLLLLWTAACVQSIIVIACQFAGAEIIRADRTGLETSIAVGPIRWSRFFRAEDILNLTNSDPNAWDATWPWPLRGIVPRPGAIKFDYCGRTIHRASLADEADGPLIVDWLGAKLPRSATEPL